MLTPEELALGPMWYVAFLLSLTCHEAAHALVAQWGGDTTAASGGQVTLNPVPHIRREPFGTVLVPWVSYLLGGTMLGWASAPYDPFWQQRYPRRAARMALAGPVANFLLALLAAVLIRGGIAANYFAQPGAVGFSRVAEAAVEGSAEGFALFLSILFSLNVLLGSFNLLPVPPLDGNGVVGLFLPEQTALRFMELSHNPMFSLIGLLVAWQLFDYVFPPVFLAAVNLLYFGSGYA